MGISKKTFYDHSLTSRFIIYTYTTQPTETKTDLACPNDCQTQCADTTQCFNTPITNQSPPINSPENGLLSVENVVSPRERHISINNWLANNEKMFETESTLDSAHPDTHFLTKSGIEMPRKSMGLAHSNTSFPNILFPTPIPTQIDSEFDENGVKQEHDTCVQNLNEITDSTQVYDSSQTMSEICCQPYDVITERNWYTNWFLNDFLHEIDALKTNGQISRADLLTSDPFALLFEDTDTDIINYKFHIANQMVHNNPKLAEDIHNKLSFLKNSRSKKETSGKTGQASGQNNLHNGALNNGQIMQKPQGLQHNLPQNNVSSGNQPQNNAQVQNNVQNVIPQNIPQKHGQQSSIPKNTILQNGTQQTPKQQLPPKPAVLSVQQPQKVPLQSNVNPSLDKSQNLGQNLSQNLSQNQGQNQSQNTGQNSQSIHNSVQNSQTGVQVAQVNQNIGQNTQNIQNTAHYNHINTQNNLQNLPTNQKHATISTQPPKQFAKVPMNEVTSQKTQQLIQPQVIQKVSNQQTTPQNNLQNNLQHNIQNNLQNNKVHTLPSNPQPTNAPPQVSATPVLPTTDSREAILRLVDENSSSFKARLQVLMENLSMSGDNQHLEEKSRLKKEKGELESKNKKQSTKIKRLEFENNQLRERVTFLENQLNTLDGADGADGVRSGNDGSDQEDQT